MSPSLATCQVHARAGIHWRLAPYMVHAGASDEVEASSRGSKNTDEWTKTKPVSVELLEVLITFGAVGVCASSSCTSPAYQANGRSLILEDRMAAQRNHGEALGAVSVDWSE